MKAYKGFNKDMTCRGFQYEEGREYEHEEKVECCESGFHACEYPLDVFSYYEPCKSIYHEVEIDGDIDREGEKVCASKIKIGASLNIAGIVKAAIEYTTARIDKTKSNAGDYGASSATRDYGASSATGYCGASSASGNCGASSATGYKGASSATGDYGASSASGNCGASSATGYKGASSTEDKETLAVAWGYMSKAKGCLGSYIVITEWEYDGEKDAKYEGFDYRNDKDHWHLKEAKMLKVDGEVVKPDTWYTLVNGEMVEACS